MERLTDSNKEIPSLKNERKWLDMYFKLKEYEDAEENGLLVRLPCKVGDTLYEPGRKQISEYKVKAIRVELFAIWIEWDIEKGICLSRIDGVNADEIRKTVFLTQEEAEAKLKEMEGENAD